MVKSEAFYRGIGGELYLARNRAQLRALAHERQRVIRSRVEWEYGAMQWCEVGCGLGTNMGGGDVGIDIDERVIVELNGEPFSNRLGLVGRAQDLHFLTAGCFPVVFCVGLLMHLPEGEWQKALAEMCRISRGRVMIGEYVAEQEKDLRWQGEAGLLWERPYPAPVGWHLRTISRGGPAFDADVRFLVFGNEVPVGRECIRSLDAGSEG